MSQLRVKWLGRHVPYEKGMVIMQEAILALTDRHTSKAENILFLLEHQDVITTTTQGGENYLRTSEAALLKDGIQRAHATRGGDITFHGPGQLVGYPVIRLPFLAQPPAGRVDILKYLRTLEQALIYTCEQMGLKGAHAQKDRTGIWVSTPPNSPKENDTPTNSSAKMIAIGVGVKRGITRHGFAFNLHTDLERFTRHIVPCGLENRAVTSLERVLLRQSIQEIPHLRQICQLVSQNLSQGLGLKPPSDADFEGIPDSLALDPPLERNGP